MVALIDGTTKRKYVLAEGTRDEVWLEMPEETMLANHKKWFGHLLGATVAFGSGRQEFGPLMPGYQALFVFWQYVSFDISRLREDNAELQEQIRTIHEHNVELEGRISSLESRLAALEGKATPAIAPDPTAPSD